MYQPSIFWKFCILSISGMMRLEFEIAMVGQQPGQLAQNDVQVALLCTIGKAQTASVPAGECKY